MHVSLSARALWPSGRKLWNLLAAIRSVQVLFLLWKFSSQSNIKQAGQANSDPGGQMAQDLITKTYKSSFKAEWELHHLLLLTSKSDCLLNHDWRQANKLQFPLPRCVWAVYLPLLRKGEWVGNMQVCERGSGWSLLDAADARPSALQCLKALGCALSTSCHQCKQLRQSKAIKGSTMREFKQNSSVSRSGILFEAKASSLTPVTPTRSTLHPSC